MFKFIHIADLHLGRGFTNISDKTVQESARKTLERVKKFCAEIEADILLVAGDSYEADGTIPEPQFFCDTINAIAEAGTKPFIVFGNHDPLSISYPIKYHDDVVCFGTQLEVKDFTTRGGDRVCVAGFSYAQAAQQENPFKSSQPFTEAGAFNIALLHCDIVGAGGNAEDDNRYAEITTDALRKCGAQYVALGHVHNPPAPDTLGNQDVRICYPGALQGASICDLATGGAYVGEVENGKLKSLKFVPLAYAHWQSIDVDITRLNVTEATQKIWEAAKDAVKVHDETCSEGKAPKHHIFRVTLTGETSIDHISVNNLQSDKVIFFEKILNNTVPLLKQYNLDRLKNSGDLLGSITRAIDDPSVDEKIKKELEIVEDWKNGILKERDKINLRSSIDIDTLKKAAVNWLCNEMAGDK